MKICIEHEILGLVLRRADAEHLLNEASFLDALIDQFRREAKVAISSGNPTEQLRYQLLDAYVEFGKVLQGALLNEIKRRLERCPHCGEGGRWWEEE